VLLKADDMECYTGVVSYTATFCLVGDCSKGSYIVLFTPLLRWKECLDSMPHLGLSKYFSYTSTLAFSLTLTLSVSLFIDSSPPTIYFSLPLHFPPSLFLCRWIEVDKILDVREEDVTEVVDEHPPPVTAGVS
jgi:hypothetical protein